MSNGILSAAWKMVFFKRSVDADIVAKFKAKVGGDWKLVRPYNDGSFEVVHVFFHNAVDGGSAVRQLVEDYGQKFTLPPEPLPLQQAQRAVPVTPGPKVSPEPVTPKAGPVTPTVTPEVSPRPARARRS